MSMLSAHEDRSNCLPLENVLQMRIKSISGKRPLTVLLHLD